MFVFLLLGSPECGTLFWVWHDQWALSIGEKDNLLQPASKKLSNTAQVTTSLPCHKDALLAHVQLGVHQASHVLFCQAASQLGSPFMYWCTGLFLPSSWLSSSAGWTSIGSYQLISPAWWVSWMVMHLSDVSDTPSSFVPSANVLRIHSAIVWIINEDVQQDLAPYWPQGHTANYWHPPRLSSTEHQPLALAIQPFVKPLCCLLTQHMHQHFLLEGFMEDSTKGVAEVQVDVSCCSALIY